MIYSELVTDTLLFSRQSSNEDRESIIKDIERQMENETNPNVIAFFDWYKSTLKSWNDKSNLYRLS